MSYTVKAFTKFDELIEPFETKEQAESRYKELKADNQHDAVYLFEPNGDLAEAWQDSYYGWEPETPTCVYCGSTCLDGYCWRSPDGFHVGNM